MSEKELDPNSPAAKGYETPTFDKLRPRWKTFVLHFLKHHDEEAAAEACGYVTKSTAVWGFEIGRHPDVVKAMEEITARNMNAAEFSRAAVVARLKAESTVSMEDLCVEMDLPYNNTTTTVKKWRPRPIEDIDKQYQQCMGFITVSREGNAIFNNSAQHKSRQELAKYMNWDKQGAETNPPISFDFSGLKGSVS